MSSLSKSACRWMFPGIAILFVLVAAGCGAIADPQLIKVAKIDGAFITRGDLAQFLRELPNEERPTIATHGDLVRALRMMIDQRIKPSLGITLKSEGKIDVPRELAERRFYSLHPEMAVTIGNPADFNMTEQQVKEMEAAKEAAIDETYQKMLGDAAIGYLLNEGVKNGTLTANDQELAEIYELRKDELRTREAIVFRALCFPLNLPEARSFAAEVRRRLDAGESLEGVAPDYLARRVAVLREFEMENNPSLTAYAPFWREASGAQPGSLLGPAVIPASRNIAADRGASVNMPDLVVAGVVLENRPPRQKTIEEARSELLPDLLLPRVMDQLYAEHGVEFYEDKLPDVSSMGERPGQKSALDL